jgi:glycerol kinase
MSVLVIDAGTSGIRGGVIRPDASVACDLYEEVLPDSPVPGLVEFDAVRYADVALDLARRALAEAGPVDGVGISNQRASTVVWDRATGEPVAPALGWQDLRTVGDCLVLAAEHFRFAPNQSATKVAHILDSVDPDRRRDLCIGTPDSWLIWRLTDGEVHVTDLTNAAVTGLMSADCSGWDPRVLERLRIPEASLPAIVDSSGMIGAATALDGSPPICGVAGDQQASLIGQGCVRPGLTKITFGTGGMLDACQGTERPQSAARSTSGTFPIVCWRRGDETMWGLEAIMLSAGTNVEWLRDDLGIIATSAESAEVAAQCDTSDGVVYVPAQLGLGTPRWDYGARSGLFGLTRGSTRAHVVRAVLEGVAQRGADLVDAARIETGMVIDALRIDGGMSENPVFTQAVADATGCVVEVAPVKEATSLGAAFLAGLELGTWSGWDEIEAAWKPSSVIEPSGSFDRERWADAVDRAAGWHGDLSNLDF